jgi:hypothetical protein
MVPKADFAAGKRDFQTAPISTASAVLAVAPGAADRGSGGLGDIGEIAPRKAPAVKPLPIVNEQRAATGAAERRSGAPLDKQLWRTKVYGDRTPVESSNGSPTTSTYKGRNNDPLPETGVVLRKPPEPQPGAGRVIEVSPIRPSDDSVLPRVTRKPPPEMEVPKAARQPRFETPSPKSEPRSEPPPREKPAPKSEPAPKEDAPVQPRRPVFKKEGR